MKKENIIEQFLKELEKKSLTDKQSKLLDGLCETYNNLKSIGLNALRIISTSAINDVLSQEYHEYLSKDSLKNGEEIFFKSVFCLIISREEYSQAKKMKP